MNYLDFVFLYSNQKFSQHPKNVIAGKTIALHFCVMNGGNKSIAAKRYVHGIIQIQVKKQVLPFIRQDLLNLNHPE